MTDDGAMAVFLVENNEFWYWYKNLMQCVAPTQLAVTKIVTQTPKYIFCASSEQQDSLHFVNFLVLVSLPIGNGVLLVTRDMGN